MRYHSSAVSGSTVPKPRFAVLFLCIAVHRSAFPLLRTASLSRPCRCSVVHFRAIAIPVSAVLCLRNSVPIRRFGSPRYAHSVSRHSMLLPSVATQRRGFSVQINAHAFPSRATPLLGESFYALPLRDISLCALPQLRADFPCISPAKRTMRHHTHARLWCSIPMRVFATPRLSISEHGFSEAIPCAAELSRRISIHSKTIATLSQAFPLRS